MAQPSLQDLVAGVDMTGIPDPSAIQVNNLVNQAMGAVAIGFVITTTDIATVPTVPDAITHIKWQQYIWRRVSAGGIVTIYIWNTTGATDGTFQNWVSLSEAIIGYQSITTNMIALLAITDAQISNVSWGKITGTPTFIQGTDGVPAGNFINSTYNNLVIAANSVIGTMLAAASIDLTKLLPNNANGLTYARTNQAKTAWEWALDILNVTNAGATGGLLNALGPAYSKIRMTGDATQFEYWDTIAVTDAMTLVGRFGTNGQTPNSWIIPHGFVRTPRNVRTVIVCTINDGSSGWNAGYEIPIEHITYVQSAAFIPQRLISVGADITVIEASYSSGVNTGWYVSPASGAGAAPVAITLANWSLKVYYQP